MSINRTSKTLKAIDHRGTEFYFVNSAAGAVNKKSFSLCPLRLCGKKLLTLFLA